MTAHPLQTGLVVSGHGRHCVVESADGQRRICHPRGKKNPVLVGDHVDWASPAPGQGDVGTIERVHPRRNQLYRQDELRTKAFAANIDQVLIWLAAEPEFSPRLLTRALIAASAANIPALIALNKADLRTSHALGWQRLQSYRDMGYQTLSLSLLTHQTDTHENRSDGMSALHHALHGCATLILGPSGSGKSSLVNSLIPNAQVQTGEISQALQSGRHTTTSTHWYWVDRATGTAVIDSPGFQEFGLHHIDASHIAQHMPDLHAYAGQCRFYNCTHIHEPGCAVRAAVSDATNASTADGATPLTRIDPTRYALYAELYAQLSQPRYD